MLSELELSEAKEAGDGDGSKGSAYDHLGSLYRSLGDFQKGIEFHQQALKIAKETEDKRVQRRALENLVSPIAPWAYFERQSCSIIKLSLPPKGLETEIPYQERITTLVSPMSFLVISKRQSTPTRMLLELQERLETSI